jgi:exocyst complex protein 7
MPPPTNEPFDLLAAFFSDGLDALTIGLEKKGKEVGKKNSIVGFFLQTNLTLVEQTLRQSDLHKILGEYGYMRLDRLKKRSLNLFLEGWQVAAQHLMDTTFIQQTSKDGKKTLSSKDREAIKEKFKAFNAEFDQLIQRQRSYNLTDPELRNYMVDQITSLVRPLYHRFYDKHKDGDFSKNVDKVSFCNSDSPKRNANIVSI